MTEAQVRYALAAARIFLHAADELKDYYVPESDETPYYDDARVTLLEAFAMIDAARRVTLDPEAAKTLDLVEQSYK